jgi:hypothetical protein
VAVSFIGGEKLEYPEKIIGLLDARQTHRCAELPCNASQITSLN